MSKLMLPSNKETTDYAWDDISSHGENIISGDGVDWSHSGNSPDILHYEYKDQDGKMTISFDHLELSLIFGLRAKQWPNNEALSLESV